MDNFQEIPIKVYIQDIFRAKTTLNRYIYELFGMTFKNIMIHGVVTDIYNASDTKVNLEVSDATGSVQIYYDSSKNKSHVTSANLKDLSYGFSEAARSGNCHLNVISSLMKHIEKKPSDFSEGDYLSVVGDIFIDDKNVRLVSAYDCVKTSVERDIVWMEELRYLYKKYYVG